MKKFLLIIAVFAILINNMPSNNFTLKDYFTGEYHCYTTQDVNGLNLGFCVSTPNKTNCRIGESIKIENLEIESALKALKAKVVNTEYLENGTTVIYAYSSLIKESVTLNNNKVNVQLATSKNTSIIGWPLIIGSF